MPSSLDQLLDQYGGEASSGHYGVAVYQTVDAVMGNPGVREDVSPITTAGIAAIEVAAYEVLTGSNALESLANLAINTAMDLAGQIAAEALESAAGVVPIVGKAFEFILGIQTSIDAQARAERIAEAKRNYEACLAKAETYRPIGTGDYGAITPSDLFLQARPVHNGWEVMDPPRVPYLGQYLELVTEQRWPGWALHFLSGNPTLKQEAQGWGYNDGPIFRGLWGSDACPWNGRGCGPLEWFPETDWYVGEFKRLREAIREMHPFARARAGLPKGDQGQSLWGIYLDMLYAILHKPRHPFTRPGEPQFPIKDHTNFHAWAPALPVDKAIQIYGGPISYAEGGQPSSLGIPNIQRALDLIEVQHGRVPPELRAKLPTVCGGQPDKAIHAILAMASDWRLHVEPQNYQVEQAQKQAIREVAQHASSFARARLEQLGVTQPTAAPSRQAVQRVVTELQQGGVISPTQADEAAQAVNGGADPGKLALYLGAAAVGAGALAWAVL